MGIPISPVIQGLMQAYSVGNMLKEQAMSQHRMKMQEQQLALQRAEQERAAQHQELTTKMNVLDAGGTPVQSGMVQDQAEVPGIEAPVPVARKADRGRVVKVGGQEYELPTREQQVDLAARREETLMRRRAKLGQQMQQEDLSANGLELTPEQSRAFGVKPGTKLSRGEFLKLSTDYFNQNEATGRTKEATTRAEKLAEVTDKRARELADLQDSRARDIAEGNNRSREKAAAIRASGEGGLPPTAKLKLEQDIQGQHAERMRLGQLLATPDGKTYLDGKEEVKMNALRRAQLRRQYSTATAKLNLLERQAGGPVTPAEADTGRQPAVDRVLRYNPQTGKLE